MTAHQNLGTLVLVTAVSACPEGKAIRLDVKFAAGVQTYCSLWPGKVTCIMPTGSKRDLPFSSTFSKDDLDFDLLLIPRFQPVTSDYINGASAVLVSGDNFFQLHLAKFCTELNIPCIYIAEYDLRTRLKQIILQNINLWKKIKSGTWVTLKEQKRRKAYKLANGLQTNGIPASRAYGRLNDNVLEYFDSRISKKLMGLRSEVHDKVERLRNGDHLRLVFSGRLDPIKGVQDLIPIAETLRSREVPFVLNIYGSGLLERDLRERIAASNLSSMVKLNGKVDFETELVPIYRKQCDLFICCHSQSDPSCTYLEALSCGLPIVGYLNRAFSGILKTADVGWGVRTGNVAEVAKVIADIGNKIEVFETKAVSALRFGEKHCFEDTFTKRIEQLIQCTNKL